MRHSSDTPHHLGMKSGAAVEAAWLSAASFAGPGETLEAVLADRCISVGVTGCNGISNQMRQQ